jgi:hypothetical protein
MTGGPGLHVAKEVRALLPLWGACVAGLLAGAVSGVGQVQALGVLVYGVGSVALGAYSIGHEHTHRTLPMLLTQPAGRIRLFLVKLSVVAAMLLTLAAAAWGSGLTRGHFHQADRTTVAVFILLFGVFVAPWLTMVARSAIGGAVFTAVIPGWLWLATRLFVDAPRQDLVFRAAMLAFSGLAAVLGWRAFMRLESIEGGGSHVPMPFGRDGAMARTGHPVWLLVKKELGLQQMALAVGALYVVIWLALVAAKGRVPALDDTRSTDLFVGVAVMYSGMLALLIGALASAEERQLGTADWQALLPMSSLRQWAIKAGTAIVLALLLSAGLPALLVSISGGQIGVGAWFLAVILVLTVCALYVSSLCGNGVRALVLSLAPAMAVTYMVERVVRFGPSPAVSLAVLAVFVALALSFALQNHRSAERGAGRVYPQLLVMLLFGVALLTVGSMVHLR